MLRKIDQIDEEFVVFDTTEIRKPCVMSNVGNETYIISVAHRFHY